MSQFIKFYFTSSVLNMFRTLIHPSSGACDFSIVSSHWLCVFVSMCVGVTVWLFQVSVWQAEAVLQPATWIPPQPATPKLLNTHRNKNTQPMWWYNRKVAGSWWWMYLCSKHVEQRRSEIKVNKLWHQVGLLFFNYHLLSSIFLLCRTFCCSYSTRLWFFYSPRCLKVIEVVH